MEKYRVSLSSLPTQPSLILLMWPQKAALVDAGKPEVFEQRLNMLEGQRVLAVSYDGFDETVYLHEDLVSAGDVDEQSTVCVQLH